MENSIGRPTSTVQWIILMWHRMQWIVCFLAIVGVDHANAQNSKPAEPTVATTNQSVRSQLPFDDRQDFEEAMRGFIGTTPDPSNPERYAFLNREAPPTANPSLWRQAQLNVPNG